MYSDKNLGKIIKLMENTKPSFIGGGFTNGVGFDSAYHTLYFGEKRIQGQRDNKIRYEIMKKKINFNKKNVIDFGFKTGGLLFQLGKDVSYGIGFDYDSRCINVANCLNNYEKKNLSFYTHDFDRNKIVCHKISKFY